MTYPQPVQYPLGPPTISGTTISVDLALEQPAYISARLADLSLQKFITSYLFASGGVPVQGGAVIYDQVTKNWLYTDNDVEQVMPGGEFPLMRSSRSAPLVAQVAKYGGKFKVTDEARTRNQITGFNRQVTMLSNTIVKKVNTIAVAAVNAMIGTMAGATTVQCANHAGGGWGGVVVGGSGQTPNNLWPHADWAAAQSLADQQELGVTLDVLLVNPVQAASLKTIYGNFLNSVLESFNLTMFASNRIVPGTGYMAERGGVGFLEYEQGLNTESFPDRDHESTTVQSSVRPVMGITNPYSIYELTTLGG